MQLADAALTTADQKERLSVSYVLALAAKAGYTTAEHDLDRIGIDMEIHAGDQMPPASLARLPSVYALSRSASNSVSNWKL